MKSAVMFTALLTFFCFFPIDKISAQVDDLYFEGTVWTLTFVRTDANKGDEYLKGLANTWVANMEEAKKEGLIVSYKILSGPASNKDDFNLILMIENKNMAALDPDPAVDAKFDAIEKRIKDKMGDKYDMTVTNYDVIRDLQGTKFMRELHLKK